MLLTREPKHIEKKNNAADERGAERRMRTFPTNLRAHAKCKAKSATLSIRPLHTRVLSGIKRIVKPRQHYEA